VSLGQAPRLSFRAHVVRLVSGEPVNRVPRPGRDIDFPKGSNQGLARSFAHARKASPSTGDSSMTAHRLIPYDALAAKCIPYSKPHLWRLEKAGKFPKRVPIGAGRYGYVESEIDCWIEARVRERDEMSARHAAARTVEGT
jgi:prophage regulatory protein